MPDYAKTLEYLDKEFSGREIKLGLERISRLAEKLGNPQNSFKSVIVGGTNGKGSTSAMLASMLDEAGYRTGLYTSPHLFDVRERIRVSGRIASKRDFAQVVDEIRRAGADEVTYFEFLTLAAFLHFKRKNVDVAILEVGLGGRFDAVNIADAIVSVITGVAFDHRDYLGNSIGEIAYEKAGIIKKSGIVIAGEMSGPALDVIEKESDKKNSKLFVSGKDFCAENVKHLSGGFVFDYKSKWIALKSLKVNLAGGFQAQNASVALSAFLRILIKLKGAFDREKAVRKGLLRVKWRGRMEKMRFCGRQLLFDCAHNSDALRHLSKYLAGEVLKRDVFLIFGVLRDKDIPEMLSLLEIPGIKIVFTKPDNIRAENPFTLKQLYSKAGKAGEVIGTVDEPLKAYRSAFSQSAEKSLICVAGSVFLVAPLLNYIEGLKKEKSLLNKA